MTLSVVDALFQSPVISVTKLAAQRGLSYNAVQSAVNKLEGANIVSEISGRQRNRLYVGTEILAVLQQSEK